MKNVYELGEEFLEKVNAGVQDRRGFWWHWGDNWGDDGYWHMEHR